MKVSKKGITPSHLFDMMGATFYFIIDIPPDFQYNDL